MSPSTLCEAFQLTAQRSPDATAVRTPGDTNAMTWRDYANQVERVAAALTSLGIRRGDTVALMMANRPEFYPLEVGAQHVGATSFSVYSTMPAEQLTHIFTNAGNRLIFCESQYVERIRASGAPVEWIVCIDGAPEGTLGLDEFLAGASPDFDFEATWRRVQPDDTLTLIYTSGTTGHPKGVEMTHASILFTANAIHELVGLGPDDRVISYLPSAHIADRFIGLYLQETYGVQVTTVADFSTVAAALPDARPTIFASVPRVWEKLRAAVESAPARTQDPAARAALENAMQTAAGRAMKVIDSGDMAVGVTNEWLSAERQVLRGLRGQLGLDAVRWAVSGGAAVSSETLAFFAGLGLPIGQNWGMSELGAVASVSTPDRIKLGTVGKLLPGVEARTARDGELLVRGPLVMKGYRKEPEKTAEAIDTEGWLHTGDIATIDDDGYVTIIDRKKDLIINAGGKNMSPANIERAIKAQSSLIGAAVVIGDARPYNTALLVLDMEAASAYAAERGLPENSAPRLAGDPEVIEYLRTCVAEGNKKLARVEQIKRFRILPVYWEPGGAEVTMTMKVKRNIVIEKYAAEVEALYSDSLQPGVYEPAVVAQTH